MAGRNERKKELAYLLYLQGIKQVEICDRVGIGSSRTLASWIKKGGWKEKMAAKTISRTELINKTLTRINELLESDEFEADKLSKMAALVEKLDKQDSPIIVMDILMGFGKWLHIRSSIDKEVDLEFIQKMNKFQDLYITQKLNGE